MDEFMGAARPLTAAGLQQATEALGTGAAEIWTVLSVETRGCGFLSDRRPLILFERHVFHRETGGVYDASHPEISCPEPGGYQGGVREYERFLAARALDAHAALDSASWGIGQVMGYNAGLAGFPCVEAMVAAMIDTEDAQLAAVAAFLASERLAGFLGQHNWEAFARGYNGSAFARNQYDSRLAACYRKFSAGPLPDLAVREAQVLLTFLGGNPGVVDGILGRFTRSAVAQFRQQKGLGASEDIDDALLAALRQSVAGLERLIPA